MRLEKVAYAQTNMLHPITVDYLQGTPNLKSLFQFEPSFQGLEEALNERTNFSVDRALLVETLRRQYGDSVFPEQAHSLERLLDDNTFTIVTGHQLNLFTGPLYFVYKIFSVIKMAERLNEAHPDKHIVPVYWMATEDHDFDEINHFRLYHSAYRWGDEQKGAVGRFGLEDLQPVLHQIEKDLGTSLYAKQVLAPFLEAYRNGKNLAEATRMLVHQLFKGYPLIVVDGDAPELKRAFLPAVHFELFGEGSQPLVDETLNHWASLGYKPQVPGRAINLFYLKDGIRERIEKSETGFTVVNTTLAFTEEEMRAEMEAHAERFSPNVILRPVFQELILPNLSYVGGGAEVAYWLQLKGVFEALNVFFPQVMLRDGFVVFSERISRKMDQEDILSHEVFMDCDDHLKAHVHEEKGSHVFFEKKRDALEQSYSEIIVRMKDEDATLEPAALASLKRGLNELNKLEKKLIRAEKRNANVVAERLYAIRGEALPNGKVQERYLNIVQMLLDFGNEEFLKEIYTHCDAFDTQFKILKA